MPPTLVLPTSAGPVAALRLEPTEGGARHATPCGGRHPWPPQKLAAGAPGRLASLSEDGRNWRRRVSLLALHLLVHGVPHRDKQETAPQYCHRNKEEGETYVGC